MADADAELEQAVDELMLATGQLLRRLRAETNGDELTWSQAAVLGRLERSGAMSIADLARAESVRPQSMGASLAALEEEGLVARNPHPTDARQSLFALTARGEQARRERRVAKQEWLRAAMSRLTAEERRTLIAASALIRGLSRS